MPANHCQPHTEEAKANLQQLCRTCNEKKQARTADYRTAAQLKWMIEFKRIEP